MLKMVIIKIEPDYLKQAVNEFNDWAKEEDPDIVQILLAGGGDNHKIGYIMTIIHNVSEE